MPEPGPACGPDFLGIGLQKAGTGWLYDQLQFHPDFWMPPVKELHYFDRDFPGREVERLIEALPLEFEVLNLQRRRRGWRELDPRDLAFVADAERCLSREPDLESYATLFRAKGALLSGDITPAYSTLDEGLVRSIAGHFPRLKVVLLLRDPVARFWSQANMLLRRGKIEAATLTRPGAVQALLETADVATRSFPSRIFERWARHVPAARIRHAFLDDVVADPARVRHELLSFLGADPARSSCVAPSFNRKADAARVEMGAEVRALLVEHFAPEIRSCAEVFGGAAAAWKARHGL